MRFCIFHLLILLASPAIAQDEPPGTRNPALVEVMVLGTFHFTGGGSDYVNPEVDDFLAPHRQTEIAEVLDRLAAFQPDKIMVELPPEHADAFNAAYDSYRAGERSLSVNERQQIGMALAARLGHDRLYAVDHASDMDFDAMMAAANSAGQAQLLASFQSQIERVQAYMSEHQDGTVRERLIAQNAPELMRQHALYNTLAQLGTPDDPVGAREMGRWWERNIIIFARTAQQSDPGDRILLIYGSGHKALLDRLFDDAVEFQLIDPLTYLD